MAEIAVGAPAFPHPPAADDTQQSRRFGMTPFQCLTLSSSGVVDLVAYLTQIPEVVLALFVQLRGALATTVARTRVHAEHRHQHHHREHHEQRVGQHVPAAGHDHHRDHAHHGDHHHHRHHLHQQTARNHTRNIRWHLNIDLAAGRAWSRHACPPHKPFGRACRHLNIMDCYPTPGTETSPGRPSFTITPSAAPARVQKTSSDGNGCRSHSLWSSVLVGTLGGNS